MNQNLQNNYPPKGDMGSTASSQPDEILLALTGKGERDYNKLYEELCLSLATVITDEKELTLAAKHYTELVHQEDALRKSDLADPEMREYWNRILDGIRWYNLNHSK